MKQRGHFTKDPIKFLFIVVTIACIVVLCFTVLKLNEIPQGNDNAIGSKMKINPKDGAPVGKLGEIVIKMLPQDLGFTLFLPSEKAFERDLGLGSIGENENGNDTYAILTRILGFSAVPRMIYASDVEYGKEIDYDSISGYTIYISKGSDGLLRVNGIASEMVDIRRGEIVVHVMDGVIMDSEFEQSVRPEDD